MSAYTTDGTRGLNEQFNMYHRWHEAC